MFTKCFTLSLVVLVLNLAFGSLVFAQNTQDEKTKKRAEKLKAQVTKLGIGKEAKIKVKLTNGQIVRGYISQINENSFIVVSDSAGSATEIQYADATKFDREPIKFKRWQGLLIAAGVVIGIAFAVCGGVCVD